MMKFVLNLLLLFFPLVPLAFALEETSAPPLAAKAYVLYDYDSGQFLVEQNVDEHVEPASLTKLMTAYLTFAAIEEGQLSLEQKLIPSTQAVHSESDESRMFLIPGKPVLVDDLLHGLIVDSANDAARTLAENIASNESAFANDKMNPAAQRLGMTNSHFVNASGLPQAQHYSSAHDLALLAAAILHDFPEFYKLYSIKQFEFNHISQFNRNKLLWQDPYVDGMKTGHTESAGFCLVASAKRDQHRLVSVVLGTASNRLRSSESQRLLNYGFMNFELVPLYKKEQPVSSLRVWKGTEKQLNVGFRRDQFVTIPKGQRDKLKATLESRQPLIAPISKGQQIGTLTLSLNGKPIRKLPLLALDNVALANVFSRGVDSIRLLLQKL